MNMKKQARRKSAAKRFKILNYDAYCAERALPRTDANLIRHSEYVERKQIEAKALGL